MWICFLKITGRYELNTMAGVLGVERAANGGELTGRMGFNRTETLFSKFEIQG
jgi:hypothetical protein